MRSTPTSSFKHLVLAGLLATIGIAASAQTAAPAAPTTPPAATADKAGPPHGPRGDHRGRPDPAKMQEHMAKRAAELKAKLKLTPAQEPAWAAFTTSMQPPAPHARPERGDFAKLTTPERIDKMRAMRAQRDAEMDQRGDAAKTFYAALTPEQQKVFDANAMKHRPGGPEGKGHWGRGGPDGRPHGGPDTQPKG